MRERTASATWSRSAGLSRRRMRRADPWLITAALALLALVFLALFGERIAPHESIYFVVEHGADPRPYDPGLVFPFGSDVLGRDLFSLVLAGARATLTIVLLAGLARVGAGVLVAALGSWWRPARLLAESLADFVAAVPATLVALVLVKVFVKTDTSVLVLVGALLLMGWAGPYRVIRAEVDRLARTPFIEGARAIGVGRSRLFWRHQFPHLVPIIAINLSQQVVASLVLVAELGVLGVFVGATRIINIEESLQVVRVGPQSSAQIADPPEWGGLLANARTVESLWTTRWLILVPGIAFAITALAVAAIGFALARRYARRDIFQDLRGRGAAVLVAAVLVLFVGSSLLPERYAAAREWAAAARAEVGPTADVASAFAAAGLVPLAPNYAVHRDAATVAQTGPATATVGGTTVSEDWPRTTDRFPGTYYIPARSFVTADTGGGVVEAPLVFAGHGISPSDYPPQPPNPFAQPDLGTLIKDYADDYAAVDVRGKVVLLVRFLGVAGRVRNSLINGYSLGPSVDDSIAQAIKRGAAAVLFVDNDLSNYTDRAVGYTIGATAGVSPYLRLEQQLPPTSPGGVPVVVMTAQAANTLLAGTGVDLTPFLDFDDRGSDVYKRSRARDLGISARVAVPLARQAASVTSFAGAVDGVPGDAGRVLVWAVRQSGDTRSEDVLAALARPLAGRRSPFIFVDFDPSVDPSANARAVTDLLKGQRISLVIVLQHLDGTALRFTTPYGDLIPALDLYADAASARHEVTRFTADAGALSGIAPFVQVKTVLVEGVGSAGDLRPDAAALVGYLAGRRALGAEELPR